MGGGNFGLRGPPSEEESRPDWRKTKREPPELVLWGRLRMGEGGEREERTEGRGKRVDV